MKKNNPWAQRMLNGAQGQTPQPTGVTTGAEATQPGHSEGSDATGVENVRYDRVAMQGGPRVPKTGAQVAAEGLTKTAVELARPEAEVASNVGTGMSDDAQAQPTRQPQGQEPEYDFRGFDKQISILKEAADRTKGETEDERKARQKRERNRKIVAAVSDGLNALSNLWFTSQYAPNMYEHKGQSQLDGLQRHYERMRQEREANRDKHLQYALRLGDVYNARDAAMRARRAAAAAAARQAAEDERAAELNAANVERAEAQRRWYDAKAKAEPVRAQAAKVKAQKTGSRGGSGGGSRSGKPAEYPWYDRNGKLNWSHSYEAMRQNALREGTWVESTGTSTRTTHNSVTDADETTTTPNKGRSAKPQGKKKNPMR